MTLRLQTIRAFALVVLATFLFDTRALAQDECATALPLLKEVPQMVLPLTQSATPSTPPFSCGTPAGALANDIWFAYDALSSEDVVVFGQQARLEVYEGSCGSLTSLGCDVYAPGDASLDVFVPFTATAGSRYYIRIGEFGGLGGVPGSVIVRCRASDDECGTAASILKDISTPVSTLGATPSALPMSCGPAGSPIWSDVWLAYHSLATEPIVVIAPDAVLEVYEGSCGALNSLGCSSPDPIGFFGATPSVAFSSTAGSTYYIRIADINGLTTNSTTVIVKNPIPGDECTDPLPIPTDGTVILASTIGATGSSDASCFGARTEDIWYEFSSPTIDTALISIDVGGTGFFSTIAEVYEGPCTALAPLECLESSFFFNNSTATINLTPGTNYYLRFLEWEASSTQLSVELAGSLPIELERFAAVRVPTGNAHVGWLTGVEIDTAGFNLYRAPLSTWKQNSLPESAERINSALIPAKGSSFFGAVYRYLDQGTVSAEQYVYWLEDLSVHGASTMHGPFPVR